MFTIEKAKVALLGVLGAAGFSVPSQKTLEEIQLQQRYYVNTDVRRYRCTGIVGRNHKRTTAAAQRRAKIKARNKRLH